MLSKRDFSLGWLCALLALGLAISAVAAGCGGSGSSGTATNGPDGATTSDSNGATGNGGESPGASQSNGSEEQPRGFTPLPKSKEPKLPPAKAKFVKRAGAICARKVQQLLNAVSAEVAKHAQRGKRQDARRVQAEAIDTAVLPVIRAEIEELQALKPPPGDEAQFEALLDALGEGVDVSAETEYTAKTVARFGTEFRRANGLARELGLGSCVLG